MEDGLGNLIRRLKDWHETMLKQKNSCNKNIMNLCPIHFVIKIILVDYYF